MTNKKALEIVKKEWDKQGECASCGWHGSFEADYWPDQIVINEEKKRIELPCASGNDHHRGVRIYYE